MAELSKLEVSNNVTLDSVKDDNSDDQDKIFHTNRNEKVVGLCRICYSSGVSINLTEDPYNTLCEKCKK